jgi:hypothetical protein
MRKALNHILSILILFTVSGFGLVSHVSAMPASMHQMNQDGSHSKHTQSNSTGRCATLCASAVVSRDDESNNVTENEDDDEPSIPFYLQSQKSVYDEVATKVALAVANVKPPPKVPIYILNGVFRV